MKLTVEQARKRVCPYTFNNPSPPEYPPESADWFRCSADSCMAWRWSRAQETNAYLADVRAHANATGMAWNKALAEVYAQKGGSYENTEGYCGLAGKPE